MAREKKPEIADRVTFSTTGDVVTIYYDRNDHSFYAEYNGESYRDGKFSEVRRRVVEAMKTSKVLSWIPVIEIELSDPWGRSGVYGCLDVRVKRFYICSVPKVNRGENIYYTEWETTETQRQAAMCHLSSLNSTQLPVHKEKVHFLPYNDDVWKNLCALASTIDTAAADLQNLIALDAEGAFSKDNGVQVTLVIVKKQ